MKNVIHKGELIAANSDAYKLWEAKDWKALDKHMAELGTKQKELLAKANKVEEEIRRAASIDLGPTS